MAGGGRRFARLIGYDGGMRFQFSTQQILLATAFVAITCGGIVGFRYVQSWFSSPALPWSLVWFYAAVATPLWMPSIFVAYAIGRRSFATRLVVIFALIELAAVFISWGAWHWPPLVQY